MSDYHLINGVNLEEVVLPCDQTTWEAMPIYDRQRIYAELIKDQISKIAGNKFGLICMNKLSTYDTKEKMMVEFNKMNVMFTAQMYVPNNPINPGQ